MTECSGCNGNKPVTIYNIHHHSFLNSFTWGKNAPLFVTYYQRKCSFHNCVLSTFQKNRCFYLISGIETKSHASVCYCTFFEIEQSQFKKRSNINTYVQSSLFPLQIFQWSNSSWDWIYRQTVCEDWRDLVSCFCSRVCVMTRGTKGTYATTNDKKAAI